MKQADLKMLVIEDDKLFRIGLVDKIEAYGVVLEAATKEEALKLLKDHSFDMVFIDLTLDGKLAGFDLIEEAAKSKAYPVVLSGNEDKKYIEKTYQLGSRDYLPKASELKKVDGIIQKFLMERYFEEFNTFIDKDFITQDQKTSDDLKAILTSSTRDKSIFISGPTGVGKTLVAKQIHQLSKGKDQPFIDMNCSEIPENMLEAEMFGYKKGAFTGAVNDKKGKLELADGGTLFLDEIGTMSTRHQVKLLKALESKQFTPLGAEQPVKSNFRIISATWENIGKMINEGRFRPDLFFRIFDVKIDISPLSQRKADIPLLITHFSKTKRRIIIRDEAMKYLENYQWPGNVRELKQIVDRLCDKDNGVIEAKDLPGDILENKNRFISNNRDLVGDSDINYIKKHGMKSYIDTVRKQARDIFLRRNNQNIRATMREMKVSANFFYDTKTKKEAVNQDG